MYVTYGGVPGSDHGCVSFVPPWPHGQCEGPAGQVAGSRREVGGVPSCSRSLRSRGQWSPFIESCVSLPGEERGRAVGRGCDSEIQTASKKAIVFLLLEQGRGISGSGQKASVSE